MNNFAIAHQNNYTNNITSNTMRPSQQKHNAVVTHTTHKHTSMSNFACLHHVEDSEEGAHCECTESVLVCTTRQRGREHQSHPNRRRVTLEPSVVCLWHWVRSGPEPLTAYSHLDSGSRAHMKPLTL